MGLQAWKQRDQKGGVCSSLRERAVAGLGFGQGGWGARGNRRQSCQEAGYLAYGA